MSEIIKVPMEWEPRTCKCVLRYEISRIDTDIDSFGSASIVPTEIVETCEAHSGYLDPLLLDIQIGSENEPLGKAYAIILHYLGERWQFEESPGLVSWRINDDRKVEITVLDDGVNDVALHSALDAVDNLLVTYDDAGDNGVREARTVFDAPRTTDVDLRVLDGARQTFGGYSDQHHLHQAWKTFFNVGGGGMLSFVDRSQFNVDLGTDAAEKACKHVLDFGHGRDRLTIAVDANSRDKAVNARILCDGVDTNQWVMIPPYRIGVFRCLGDPADFYLDENVVRHEVVGYATSKAITGYPTPGNPVYAGRVNFRWTTSELLCDGRRHVPYSVRGTGGIGVFVENNGVPPPGFVALALSGDVRHYRSGSVNTTPGPDRQGLDDGEKPVQMLVRSAGTLSYMQIAHEPTERNALVGLRNSGDPDGDWNLPPYPHVPVTAAEAPFFLFKFHYNDDDIAEIISNDLMNSVALDQPVGEGATALHFVGVNWQAATRVRTWDVCVQESSPDSIGYDGHAGTGRPDVPRDQLFKYLGEVDEEREWFAPAIGVFHPKTRKQLEAMPLGWADVEVTATFDLQASHLRAYLDTPRTMNSDKSLRIQIARGQGAYGDLAVDVLNPSFRVGMTDWYEDKVHTEEIVAGNGFCLRFRAEDSDLNAGAHISMVVYSLRAAPENRACLLRVLPDPVLVDQLPCSTRLARSVRIVRADGEVFAYTEHDEDITYDGTVFKSTSGFQGSSSELGAVQGEVGNMEVSGFARELGIPIADLYGGKFDSATAEVWLLPWGEDYGVVEAMKIAGGRFGKVTQEGVAYKIEALSPSAYMKQRALLEVVTPTCRYTLGEARCGVNVESMRVSGMLTSVAVDEDGCNVESHRSFVDNGRVEEAGWFTEGEITMTSGANQGQTARIKQYGAGGVFEIWEPFIYPLNPYDEYTAVPGCIKTFAVCKAKFDNGDNFGGYPHVPGLDATSQSPSGRMGE